MDIPDESDLIAPYLVSIISAYPYRRYIQYMSSDESVTEDMYNCMELSKTYWVDKRNCHKLDGSRNASAIFDMFGVFSNEPGVKVRENMIKHIEIEGKIYDSVGQVVLGMRRIKLETWCTEMKDSNQFPDELAIYALSRLYNRHTVVLCRQRYWTTLETSTPLTQEELFQACQVHLVYLGCGLFGELKLKPFSGEVPNPISLDTQTSALIHVKGKGRPRAQPLNLMVETTLAATSEIETPEQDGAQIIDRISHDHGYHKSINRNMPFDREVPPTDLPINIDSTNSTDQPISSDIIDQPVGSTTQGEAQPVGNTLQGEAQKDNQPLVQVPCQYWLHPILQEQYYGDSEANTSGMKGHNDEEENMKGRNIETDILPDRDVPDPIAKIEEMFIINAKQRKCYIPLERLQPDVIKKFCDSDNISAPPKNWNKVCDEQKVEEPKNYPPVTHSHTSYFMRTRETKKRSSTRPQRNRAVVDYAELFGQDSGNDEPEKKKPTRKPRVTTEPSKDRIAAQQIIIAQDKPKHKPPKPIISSSHRFFRKDPGKVKPKHRKPITVKTEQEVPEDIPEPDKEDEVKPGTSSQTDPVSSPPRGKFETKEHGLKKHKEVRYFKCPKCGIHKTTVMKLNEHYKRRYPPLKCDKCTMSFSTPSGLTRHRYIHSTPRYPCLDCPKTFHFSSELKTHRVVHLKIKAHFCNRGKCGKSFMNKQDLLKHVHEHDAKPMSCTQCKYITKNPRLLKSHVLSHTDEKPYSCFYCAEKFKYRMQLHRHRETCPKKPAKSDSPDY